MASLHQITANTLRGLSIDGVQQANSGHPGMPMGMADVATVLWTKFLKHNPADPKWMDRDRFILSAGHGSMLLYSLLHLSGYKVSLDDLKNFRQWGSNTPGHPEYGHTDGVELTTGPLGQGISTAVGLALAERHLAARFNKDETTVVDHFTYVIAGDGDLQEGISHESCALAGHWKLGKLVLLYDDNKITIDGPTSLSFSEDVLKRYEAYGWHIQSCDGHNPEDIEKAIQAAKNVTNKPSIIACETTIGYGSPNRAGTSGVHGSPLGDDERKLTKENLGIPLEPTFFVPAEAEKNFKDAAASHLYTYNAWQNTWNAYKNANEADAAILAGDFPDDIFALLPKFGPDDKMATRASSGKVLEKLVPAIPQMIGSSADLTPSNVTLTKSQSAFSDENPTGRYLHLGVREHGMGAILNGLTIHGGLRAYGGTFLVFADYMRGAIRLAALMGVPTAFVFTHDSIGLGEDGPTHQPVEHLLSLRAIPNLLTFRPADARETAASWAIALMQKNRPSAFALTRQGVPVLPVSQDVVNAGVAKGGYIISDVANPDVILIGTGSEVSLCLDAQKQLAVEGLKARVVSMPCTELFDEQSADYQESVLPANITARVVIEAGITLGWERYAGSEGAIIGIDRFGASAPAGRIYQEFGITAQAVVATAQLLAG